MPANPSQTCLFVHGSGPPQGTGGDDDRWEIVPVPAGAPLEDAVARLPHSAGYLDQAVRVLRGYAPFETVHALPGWSLDASPGTSFGGAVFVGCFAHHPRAEDAAAPERLRQRLQEAAGRVRMVITADGGAERAAAFVDFAMGLKGVARARALLDDLPFELGVFIPRRARRYRKILARHRLSWEESTVGGAVAEQRFASLVQAVRDTMDGTSAPSPVHGVRVSPAAAAAAGDLPAEHVATLLQGVRDDPYCGRPWPETLPSDVRRVEHGTVVAWHRNGVVLALAPLERSHPDAP